MVSPQNVRLWPTLDEYDNALKDPLRTVYDADVKVGKLSTDSRPLRLNGKSNKYVTVYKMSDWVVRCFFTNIVSNTHTISPPPDICERYQQINSFMRENIGKLSILVPQVWVEKGIIISGQDWPFMKSAFIKAEKLGEFLDDNLNNKNLIAVLAQQWLAIIDTFESLKIAHGDLDLTNVLVYGTLPNVTLRLVDFDSMYLPAMQGKKLYEEGHEHFQPIQHGLRKLNSEMDRFSALVIYLSLLALSDNPQLWHLCKANETNKLLLGSEDFRDLSKSNAYTLLRKHNNQDVQKCLNELVLSIQEKRMPMNLSDILRSRVGHIPPTPALAQTTSSYSTYSPVPIAIPIEFMNQMTPTSSQPQQMPESAIPIPVAFFQVPSNPSSSQTQTNSSGQQSSPPTPSVRRRVHPAVWWLLALAIGTAVLATAYGTAWLILTLILSIAIVIVIQHTLK